jgi:hypothetical protein
MIRWILLMGMERSGETVVQVAVQSAVRVSRFLWPDFVQEHGCVFLAQHSGSNPPPANDTTTGWESFVNHTHVFDEFQNNATKRQLIEEREEVALEGWSYDESHPDFVAACELGRTAARLWVLKLKRDFPADRFRVYYTECDGPIVRFHKVREEEPFWVSDRALQSATDPSFRNALIYDTNQPSEPISAPPV